MCGITGYVSFKAVLLNALAVIGMTDALEHRGPDDEGYLMANFRTAAASAVGGKRTDPACVGKQFIHSPREILCDAKLSSRPFDVMLGHRRLSILDLSPLGHQPLCNEDGSVWITHNGEIYNYLELRGGLEDRHKFISHTDTEVILHAYEEWGTDCVKRFNGMWAFSILDLKKKVLFISRDRTGIKPLYYYRDNERFLFASEIRPLLKVIPREVNDGAVWDYLVLRTNQHFSETFYRNIHELEPAHNLVINAGAEMKISRYWTPVFNPDLGKYDDATSVKIGEELHARIENAIRLRLRSDVPLGSCLSGGLDSSAIVSTVNRLIRSEAGILSVGDKQKTFTASFSDPGCDERKFIDLLMRNMDVAQHHIFPTGEGLEKEIDKLIEVQEEPFNSTSIYAQFKVMEAARDHGVKVLLDGQGGDELFAGYTSYKFVYLVNLMRFLRLADYMKEWGSIRSNGAWSAGYQFFAFAREWSKNFPAGLQRFLWTKTRKDLEFVHRDFLSGHKERTEMWIDKMAAPSLGKRLYEDVLGHNLKGLLRYEDKNSMHFSIEARTPFADDIELIEYFLLIPSCYKVHGGFGKYSFRKAMDGRLPDEVTWRRDKMGFNTPERQWVRGLIKRRKCDLSGNTPYLDGKRFMFALNQEENNESGGGETSPCWRGINLMLWLKAGVGVSNGLA